MDGGGTNVMAKLLEMLATRTTCCAVGERRYNPPLTAVPQEYSGLTEVLSDVATWLQNSEPLRPVVAAQREAHKDSRGL